MGAYSQELRRKISQRARELVNHRWQRVRDEQRRLETIEAADPLRMPWRIVDRVIRIMPDGVTAREAIRYESDSQRSWRRKLRRLELSPLIRG